MTPILTESTARSLVFAAIVLLTVAVTASGQSMGTRHTGTRAVVASTVQIAPSSTGYVNVRQNPDVESPVVTKVRPGDTYSFSTVRNGWYRLDAKRGWVAGRYVTVRAKSAPKRRPRGGTPAAAAVAREQTPASVRAETPRPTLSETLEWLSNNLSAARVSARWTDQYSDYEALLTITPVSLSSCNVALTKEVVVLEKVRDRENRDHRQHIVWNWRLPLGRISRGQVEQIETADALNNSGQYAASPAHVHQLTLFASESSIQESFRTSSYSSYTDKTHEGRLERGVVAISIAADDAAFLERVQKAVLNAAHHCRAAEPF
jgi:uncharacterized protein YgiM (DUF1202 family)